MSIEIYAANLTHRSANSNTIDVFQGASDRRFRLGQVRDSTPSEIYRCPDEKNPKNMIELYGRRMADDVRRSDQKRYPTIITNPTPVDDVSLQSETQDILGWHGGPPEQISFSEGNGIVAVISGEPRWGDSRFAAVAGKEGQGAALRQAYEELGHGALSQVRGRFAISITDNKRGKLLLAIDRMGIERMCYCLDNRQSLTFATYLTDLRQLRPVASEISNQSLFDFMYFNVIPSPGTVYSDVQKLEPGQFLVYDGRGVKLAYYWTPGFIADNRASEADLAGELLATLGSAVERCHITEKTGCFLSGGLDSSTVTGFASKHGSTPMDAFTIGFDQSGYDEVVYARAAAKHFGANIIEYYVTPEDIASTVDEIATTYDEPFGNSSAIPTLFCARLASEHGKTHLLAGDGGDEFFAGNDRYDTQKVFDYYGHIPRWLRSGLLEPVFLSSASNWTPLTKKIRRYIEQANVAMPERLQTYNTLYVNRIENVFTTEFLDTVDTEHPVSEMQRWYHKGADTDLLNRMLFFDWKLTLADNDIRKVNVMCDRANIRVSYPMMDDDLVDFSTRIPSNTKMRRGQLRRFFRRSLQDFLPHEVLSKSKHGFGLPFGEWLKNSQQLQSAILPHLDALGHRGIIKKDFIDAMRHKHQHEHAAYYGGILWTLVMLERWLAENA